MRPHIFQGLFWKWEKFKLYVGGKKKKSANLTPHFPIKSEPES